MVRPRLHIGDKNYSSWSMRAWLALHHGGIERTQKLGAEHGNSTRIFQIRSQIGPVRQGFINAPGIDHAQLISPRRESGERRNDGDLLR
jgi:hypothetical protein